jgi:hypothetical protein
MRAPTAGALWREIDTLAKIICEQGGGAHDS